MVVDAVVRHWTEVMVEVAVGQGGRGHEGRHKHFLFYADDGIITLTYPGWLHVAFSTLVGMFERVVLKRSVGKTVVMVYCPCQLAGTHSEATYKKRMMGAGPSYRERQRVQVQC